MIPPEPDPPGPDPPTPEPTYNDWDYLTKDQLWSTWDVYHDVGSASGSFVGVVSLGLTGSANWYSDGSLIVISNKYYPYNATDHKYYNYVDHNLYRWNSSEADWELESANPTVFDQVPADFLNYLSSGNFTLVQK